MPVIDIEPHSGFCFGVVNAIRKAEDQLTDCDTLYCLGDIVHNSMEVERLRSKGLKTLTHSQMVELHHAKVLFRAHGEPPSTYQLAKANGIEIVDATCPVVLHLQKRIKTIFEQDEGKQLLIFGKAGHAEVNGLVGQTDGKAIVIEYPEDLDNHPEIDFNKPIVLFSQTTKAESDYRRLIEIIRDRMKEGVSFESFNTICRHFGSRTPEMERFSRTHDCIFFVSDTKSSNGKALFQTCREANRHSHFISGPDDIRPEWIEGCETIGICGATSTPVWLLEEVRDAIGNICQASPERLEKL